MREVNSTHHTVTQVFVEEVMKATQDMGFHDGKSLMNKCKICNEDIKITIYRGLGYCCENHRKILMEEK